MLVLLAKAEEMLDAVQTFMIAKHVHEMVFVLGHIFQSFHGIVGFEGHGCLLLIVVFFILGGEAEISAEKWLMLKGIVAGVGFTILSKKVTLAFIEVVFFILHVIIGVDLLKNIKCESD